jgi:hypothetical protein
MQVIEIDSYVPKRVPVSGSLVLSTTGADVGATITRTSDVDWELFCTAAWFVGTASEQLRPVAANEIYNVPSSSLGSVYAKSASGTPTLVAMGWFKVTP